MSFQKCFFRADQGVYSTPKLWEINLFPCILATVILRIRYMEIDMHP